MTQCPLHAVLDTLRDGQILSSGLGDRNWCFKRRPSLIFFLAFLSPNPRQKILMVRRNRQSVGVEPEKVREKTVVRTWDLVVCSYELLTYLVFHHNAMSDGVRGRQCFFPWQDPCS
jgi:hypothetical protein